MLEFISTMNSFEYPLKYHGNFVCHLAILKQSLFATKCLFVLLYIRTAGLNK